jgi:4-methyl-5(b-hydroxyethyl)-thiazole monophosphate biosynthesis
MAAAVGLLLASAGLQAGHAAGRAVQRAPIISSCASAAPTALIPIAQGSEELEATAIVNVLRRAGWAVTLASVGVPEDAPVECARGQRLLVDATIEAAAARQYDVIAIPGGMPGAANLGVSDAVISALRRQREAGAWYGAICAAPAVCLQPAGLLPPHATCHPGFTRTLSDAGCSDADIAARVVVDDEWRCVTSRGPGTAIEFALKLVEIVQGPDAAKAVAGPMVLDPRTVAAVL